jgi:hypothetical protein
MSFSQKFQKKESLPNFDHSRSGRQFQLRPHRVSRVGRADSGDGLNLVAPTQQDEPMSLLTISSLDCSSVWILLRVLLFIYIYIHTHTRLYLPYGTSYSKTTHFLLACSVSLQALHHSTISQSMICSQQECPAILHRGGACGSGGVYGGTTGSEGYTLVNPEGEGESERLCCAGANAGGIDVARLAVTVYVGQL